MADTKDFYEDDKILRDYLEFRNSPDSPNESLEKPAFLELLGNIENKNVLDLGCGDARFGRELFEKGCASYLGVEPSGKMLEYATKNLVGTTGTSENKLYSTVQFTPFVFSFVIARHRQRCVE